jgi:hypothetical protein
MGERDQRETDGERWGASGFGENLVTNAIRQTHSLAGVGAATAVEKAVEIVQSSCRQSCGDATRGVPEWFSKWYGRAHAL